MAPSCVLIIGATRGLGESLVEYYQSRPHDSTYEIYGTTRARTSPTHPHGPNIHWIPNIDLLTGPGAAEKIATAISCPKLDTVIIAAGYFATEDFGKSNWSEQVKMYTLSSIAPVFVVESLAKHGKLGKGSKVILISSESGSITLRHEQEGGGNFGHHGSKAAVNMIGKQLSFDLKPKGVAVGIVHPSFMRTEMTKNIGFDKFWDDGGALKPEEAAKLLVEWTENEFSIEKTGTYWAPRGTRDIGNWEVVMGKDKAKEGPAELPW